MNDDVSVREKCCPSPELLERGNWNVFCAELSQSVTARKLWPRFMKRRAQVTADIFTEKKLWTIWENPNGDIVFAVSVCPCSNKKLYLKTRKGLKRTRLVIGRGKVPSDETSSRDKRIFKLHVSPLDNQLKIKHAKSGKFLYCDRNGLLRLKRREEQADSWDLNKAGPDTNSL
uniref:Uncharacterized protein LOC100187199 n=1 Tax=Phallusia mammillata TaxID=59560 RepID=A0A6F9DJB4_9ASCI|nr:uncharacterized protein LOC100187199 [Phallusia mammillata]